MFHRRFRISSRRPSCPNGVTILLPALLSCFLSILGCKGRDDAPPASSAGANPKRDDVIDAGAAASARAAPAPWEGAGEPEPWVAGRVTRMRVQRLRAPRHDVDFGATAVEIERT